MHSLFQGAFKKYLHGGYGASFPKYEAIYMSLLEIATALNHLHSLQLVHGGRMRWSLSSFCGECRPISMIADFRRNALCICPDGTPVEFLQMLSQPTFCYGALSETSGVSAASSLILVRRLSSIYTSIRPLRPPPPSRLVWPLFEHFVTCRGICFFTDFLVAHSTPHIRSWFFRHCFTDLL